ncbi:hypothetical protein TI39_contig278g00055 [Zymoseptoria brevis]|uniref:Uncharacterized protein n=1 Tax=Zymoseptoria brevis TaxID=1047168 RepID=A0A0F4GWM2_9PEZI|nr:hypothetical protein TI39_contig278g00055 [Zymoseptoria brevis]
MPELSPLEAWLKDVEAAGPAPQTARPPSSQAREGARRGSAETVISIGTASRDSVSRARNDTIQESQIPLPDSISASSAQAHNSTATASVDSLRQLELSKTTTASRIPLPASQPASATPLSHGDLSSQARAGALRSDQGTRLPHATVSVDSLLYLQSATGIAASQIALPPSRSVSAASAEVDNIIRPSIGQQDSLSQLQDAGSPVELRIPLPESIASGATKTKPMIADWAVKPVNYWESIHPLLDCLPHLRMFSKKSARHKNKGMVTCVDYLHGHDLPRVHNAVKPGKDFLDALRTMKHVTDPDVMTRFILVEDLSAEVINHVGSVLEVDPELFAEHLHRSGYGNMDYAEPLPNSWMPKSCVSLKWYRPVRQHPKISSLISVPSTLLDPQEIERKSSDVKKVAPGSIVWSDSAYSRNGRPDFGGRRHQAVVSTNIFRRSWTLSTRSDVRRDMPAIPDVADSLDSDKEESEVDWERDAIPTAWEEKVSFFRCHHGTVPTIVLLLDPLPAITDSQSGLHPISTSGHRGSSRQYECDEIQMTMAVPILPRLRLDFPMNKLNATPKDIASLKRATHSLVSTTTAIRREVESTVPECYSFRADPILALLRVVRLDSKAFFNSLEWALDEISQDSLDDYLMSRRVDGWRALMAEFEIEVPAIGRSLRDFIDFVFLDDPGMALPKDVQLILNDVDADILRIKSRLDEAYTALRADMQFSESRRSIAEARSVTKLTELAFIFIPLSFTASLFSMSIHELQNGVPLWTFIVTSLGIALFAYAVRLVLTSKFIAESSRGALERFWALSGVQRGEKAPFLTIVLFTLREIWHRGGRKVFGSISLFVLCAAFVIVPIALTWESTDLDVGFNAAISLFLVLSSLVLAFGLFFGFGDGTSHMASWGRASDTSDDSGEVV